MTFWVAGAAVVAGVGGAMISSNAAKGAANSQAGAAAASNALSKEQYDATVARNAPFVSGGTEAFNQLLARINSGSFGQAPTAEQVMSEPGYQFGLDRGMNALNRQLNARGMSYSGAQLKAASKFGNDYASGQYNNAFNRLQSADNQSYNQLAQMANMGQNSANNTGQSGANYANQAGANLQGAANAYGAAGIASGNAWTNALNQGVSAYGRYQSQPNPFTTPGSNGSYSNPSGSTYDYTNGNLYGSAGDYSDARLKTNIRPIGRTTRGNTVYAWDWKTGGSGQGVIAQEVAHIPGAVSHDADGLLMVDYSKV